MQIQLTGRLRVRGDNGVELDAAAFPGRQGRVVFAHLTLAGQPVPRDRLAEVLWPHRTPTGWRRNLAAVVSKLRGLLERLGLDPASALPGGGDCYQLCLSPRPEVDVEVAAARLVEAESALHRGDLARAAELARAAAEVARRPLLPEVDCDWVVRAVTLRRAGATSPVEGRRTVGELQSAAEIRRDARLTAERIRREAAGAERVRASAAARERRLAALRAEGEGVWRRIAALVATKKPAEHDRTVALLVDLREACSEDEFGRRISELRDEHRRKPSLKNRLDLAGL